MEGRKGLGRDIPKAPKTDAMNTAEVVNFILIVGVVKGL